MSIVCPNCLSVLDASSPLVSILQKFEGAVRYQPNIPLGSRGKFDGTTYEVIGYQIREVRSEDDTYSWSEYLLFNPYKGFRYLSEYNGHWNFIRVLAALPDKVESGSPEYQGRTYRRFSSVRARTSYVLGEFPWQVRVGEEVISRDYISPPFMLSSEENENEITWSLGEYYESKLIWQAFQLPGHPSSPSGVFPNQPSPFDGRVSAAWRTFAILLGVMIVIMIGYSATSSRQQVFQHSYTFTPGQAGEPAFVTDEFDVTGKTSNLEIRTKTDLKNDWAYFNYSLVNQTTEKARDFGREVSNYSDEGSPNDRVTLSSVPAGQYFLRVEPEKDAGSSPVNYEITVRRDVPTFGWFILVMFLLLIPPIVITWRKAVFDQARNRESDFSV